MQTRTVKTDKPRGVVRPGGRFVHHHDGNKYIGDRAPPHPNGPIPGPAPSMHQKKTMSYDVVRAQALQGNDAPK
jgi:hypothetical protein